MPSAYALARSRLNARLPRRCWTLRTYFLALIAVFIVVAAGAAAYVHLQTRRDAQAEARRDASFAADSAARQLAGDIAALRAGVHDVASTPGVAKVLAAPAGCSLSYTAMPGPVTDRGHIDIVRSDGTPVCTSLPGARERSALYRGAVWLARGRTRQHLAAPVVDPASGHHMAIIAEPIPGGGGVAAGFFDLTAVGGHLASRYGGSRGAVVLLASGDRHRVLARSIEPERWIGTSLKGTAFDVEAGKSARRDLDGRERIYSESPVRREGWILAVGEDPSATVAAQTRLESRQLLIIGAGLILFLAAVAMVHRRLAWPIAQLGNELRSVANSGQPLLVSLPRACAEEIRSLADDVNVLIRAVNAELQARREVASALGRSEASYRQLFERLPAALFIYDPQTLRFVAVNERVVTTYGYTREEFRSMTIEDIRPDGDRERVRAAVSDPNRGRVDAALWQHVRKDGKVIDVSISSDDIEFEGQPARLVLAEDVTERNQLQRQLQQIYKMDAVGQLAGGIAHDFNNLLTVIRGFSALALDDLGSEGNTAAAPHIVEVQRAAERASDLTRQLLAYSRQQVLEKASLDLNQVVRETGTLLRRVIGEDIGIETELAEDLGRVLADEGQLSQVLMNLAVNARDAMQAGGRLTIRTRNEDVDDPAAALLWGAQPGAYVVIEVADTGIGMTEETIDHLFEPFFTTKPIGVGTGLGLSTVYGIVKQSDGYIRAESAIGAGTTFTVYLPRNDSVLPTKQPLPVTSSGGGTETILVVEDEPVVRTLLGKMLAVRGYTVLAADDAQEALRLSREHEIDAVVTDVVLPLMNGPELVEELRRERPGLRALFMSGYTSDAVLQRGVSEAEVAFVQKPFTAEALQSQLRQLLDGEP